MEFLETTVSQEGGLVKVTFDGEGGEKIVVAYRATSPTELDRSEMVDSARVLMLQAINQAMPEEQGAPRSERAQDLRQALDSPAVRSYQAEKRDQRRKAQKGEKSELTRGLEASFPASDPVSPTSSVTAGPAPKPADDDA